MNTAIVKRLKRVGNVPGWIIFGVGPLEEFIPSVSFEDMLLRVAFIDIERQSRRSWDPTIFA